MVNCKLATTILKLTLTAMPVQIKGGGVLAYFV